MGTRIQELYDQAFTLGTSGYSNGELDVEKFAELIVRECAKVAWQHTPDTEELEYSHLIEGKILEHFGVEE